MKHIYLKKKEETKKLIETSEANEIKDMITKHCQDKPNFWKMMKSIKRKRTTKEKIINDTGEVIEDIYTTNKKHKKNIL